MELLITIDTEPDCDIHWVRTNPLTFTSVTEGIPKLLRPIWNKFNVKPIYFVCPQVVQNDECCEVLKKEIQLGAIIGTHLHSEYIEPNITECAGKPSYEFPCFAHSTEIEFEKIKNLTELIEKKLGVRPEWYRAARFGADLDTLQSLQKLGYKYDSSVTPFINWSKKGGPDHSKAPVQPYWISKGDYYVGTNEKDSTGIKEYPVTIWKKRLGILGKLLPDAWLFYNWLRPTHMTVLEQKNLIGKFIKRFKNPSMVMMFHSQEVMIRKSPYVRNKFMQKIFLKRIERTISYYAKLRK
jgi:hypothetical protein